jgi:hypothetical protein
MKDNLYFLIGSNSRLATEFLKLLDYKKFIKVPRNYYSTEEIRNKLPSLKNFISKKKADKKYILVFAAITKKNSEDSLLINFELPKEIALYSDNQGYHSVTFGTVMENHSASNDYINSKKALKIFLEKRKFKTHLHFQIGTLYGGNKPPEPHMFLGELFENLQSGKIFTMSSGQQLREYQSYYDCSNFIMNKILEKKTGIIKIELNESITLLELAYHLFKHFNKLSLLNVQEHKKIPNEVYIEERINEPLKGKDIILQEIEEWIKSLM